MSRTRRMESATGIYHVIIRGINHEKIFNQSREKIYFKKIILKYLEKYNIDIYSYCIMSNHAHFLIRAELKVLSVFMACILAEYATYYNFKHYRNGHVFQNRFLSECINDEQYFWSCMRYIHLNPVKAGMVKGIAKYKYSSIGEYINEIPEILSDKAIKMYQNNFKNGVEFAKFHGEKETAIFRDIDEEVETQREEIAEMIAASMQNRYKLDEINRVFEEKELRKKYIEQLKENLNLAEGRAKKLCMKMMRELDNDKKGRG